MPTDHGRNFERERELIDAHNLDAAVRMFINRWAPDDGPRDFEGDLFQIVQRIYREAQAPFVKEMGQTISRMPMQPLVVTRNPDWATPTDACIHCKQKPCACAVAQSAS